MPIVSFGRSLWAKGTRGILHGIVDQAFIENMHVYPSGLIGPRPWLKHHGHLYQHLVHTNDVHYHGIAVVPNYRRSPGSFLSYLLGSQLLLVTSSTTDLTKSTARPWQDAWTTLTQNNTLFQPYDDNLPITISNPRLDVDKRIDIGGAPGGIYLGPVYLRIGSLESPPGVWTPEVWEATLTSFSVFRIDPLGRGTIHQGRKYWYGTNTASDIPPGEGRRNRVYYSNPNAYRTFSSSSQFFDVDGEIEGMYSLGSALYIWTREGRWFMLLGRGNPADATLVSLGVQKIPLRTDSVVVHDGSLMFIPADRTGIVRVTDEGFDEGSLRHLAPSRFSRGDDATGFYTNQGISAHQWDFVSLGFTHGPGPPVDEFYTGVRAYTKYGEYWVNEEYFNGVGRAERQNMAVDEINGVVYFADSTNLNAQTYVRLYSRDIYLGRPSRSSDRWSDDLEQSIDLFGPGVSATTHGGIIGLPRITTEIYGTMRPVKVAVDARYWKKVTNNVNDYATPRMLCRVRDSDGNTHTLSSDTFFWDPAALPDTDDNGLPFRLHFSGNLPLTRWVEIWLEEIRSIAVETVHVDIDHRSGRPTA